MACLEQKSCDFSESLGSISRQAKTVVVCQFSHLDFRHPEILLQGFVILYPPLSSHPRGVNPAF